jgi:hypothetical protein
LALRRRQGGLIRDATTEQIRIAQELDAEAERQFQTEANDILVFANMAGFMPDFKHLMDSSKHGELDELCQRFPSLYRYARILEAVAAAIRSGAIKVPK